MVFLLLKHGHTTATELEAGYDSIGIGIGMANIGDWFLFRAYNIELELSYILGGVFVTKWTPLISCTIVPLVSPGLSVG